MRKLCETRHYTSILERSSPVSKGRKRYWARSQAGWRKFTAAQLGTAHLALASFEKAGRVNFMITQNVDRLHHRAGSNPLELHWTVYTMFDCPLRQQAAAIESLEHGSPGSDKSFGMKQRPDGDIGIDEEFWEEDLIIPPCQKCGRVLKPDVIFFGDNVPKDGAEKAMGAANACDAFLVLGSSVITMLAFRLARAANEAGAATAIVDTCTARADDFVPLRISADYFLFQQ
ncbi:hypothetical protein MLD38_035781 [Melastoma candidum]|uniref:Uncharacterized protein n=1 Tax=Melastoma candidum TaxID=119954 RepID=A0ACB9LI56_9MYRT|nr:hypothetical protein MLD38_035781 [Melastoma candidum]